MRTAGAAYMVKAEPLRARWSGRNECREGCAEDTIPRGGNNIIKP